MSYLVPAKGLSKIVTKAAACDSRDFMEVLSDILLMPKYNDSDGLFVMEDKVYQKYLDKGYIDKSEQSLIGKFSKID